MKIPITRETMAQCVSVTLMSAAALASMVALYLAQPTLARMHERAREQRDSLVPDLIERAAAIAASGRRREAQRDLRHALAYARTESERLQAGEAMGHLLRQMAEGGDAKHRIAASGYLRAAVALTDDSATRFRCYRALMDLDVKAQDYDVLMKDGEAARRACSSISEQRETVMWELDQAMGTGRWRHLSKLIAIASRIEGDAEWEDAIALRRAQITARMLRAYLADAPSNIDIDATAFQRTPGIPHGLAGHVGTNVIAMFDANFTNISSSVLDSLSRVSESESDTFSTGAFYEQGCLLYALGQDEAARDCFDSVLLHEDDRFLPDISIIVADICSRNEEHEEALPWIRTFLARFQEPGPPGWKSILERIVERAKRDGHGALAVECMTYCAEQDAIDASFRIDCLVDSAGILQAAHQDDEAVACLRRALALGAVDDQRRAEVLFALAGIHQANSRFAAAKDSIVQYLTEFDYGACTDDALYRLFDIELDSTTNGMAIVETAAAAIAYAPEDPRVQLALMAMGRNLEAVGLSAAAAQQYNKAGLLHYLRAGGATDGTTEIQHEFAVEAVSGNARCLLAGRCYGEAEQLLRTLCNQLPEGKLRSAAALAWADSAFEQGQFAEARRRLQLVRDTDMAPAERCRLLVRRASLADVPAAGTSAVSSRVLATLDSLATGAPEGAVTDAYRDLFRQYAERSDESNMRATLERAISIGGVDRRVIDMMLHDVSRMTLVSQGPSAFVQSVSEFGKQTGTTLPAEDPLLRLAELATQLNASRETVAEVL
jgi:tetratricopeptide (TPR) repeat protein